ncbi:MAG: hypothetical protein H0V82_06605 [Candidatus Protochlamydia sp.]|nr:hypothetical protein [Candidatus Protochlamydia sp.]
MIEFSSVPYQKSLEASNFHLDNISQNKLLTFAFPRANLDRPTLIQLSPDCKAIKALENLNRKMQNNNLIFPFNLHEEMNLLIESYDKDISFPHLYINPILDLMEELITSKASFQAAREYLSWSVQFTLNDIRGSASQLDEKVQQLYGRVIDKKTEIVERISHGHSPSYFLLDASKEPFAILKQANPEYCSSYKAHLPKMALNAPVWEHELIGFEQDQLFGFNHNPATIAVRFINKENHIVNGIIQEYISNSKAGVDLYNPKGADLLKNIPKHHVHRLALSGFFKGISAGHMCNYILQIQNNGDKFVRAIYEIDLEEILLPYNRLTEAQDLFLGEKLVSQPEQSIQSLILCRMWILGLPQSEEAFDRSALMIMSHLSLLPLLKAYQKKASYYSRMDHESWEAQAKRVRLMQKICRDELKKKTISLTPRELYFSLFGGKHLWEIAQEKKYPALIAFNNLVSDPYQHVVKNFADPNSIAISTRLEEPKENSQESIDIMNFFRKMENLDSK